MDGKRVLITTTAAWQVIVGRLQSDEQRLSVNLGIRFYRESFPEQGKRISIHRDGGESVRFVVLANSKLTGFTAVSYCFTLTRDEPFFPMRDGVAGEVRAMAQSDINVKMLQDYLKDVSYPCDKQDLLDFIEAHEAPWDVQAWLEDIPDREYQSSGDVLRSLGTLH